MNYKVVLPAYLQYGKRKPLPACRWEFTKDGKHLTQERNHDRLPENHCTTTVRID